MINIYLFRVSSQTPSVDCHLCVYNHYTHSVMAALRVYFHFNKRHSTHFISLNKTMLEFYERRSLFLNIKLKSLASFIQSFYSVLSIPLDIFEYFSLAEKCRSAHHSQDLSDMSISVKYAMECTLGKFSNLVEGNCPEWYHH